MKIRFIDEKAKTAFMEECGVNTMIGRALSKITDHYVVKATGGGNSEGFTITAPELPPHADWISTDEFTRYFMIADPVNVLDSFKISKKVVINDLTVTEDNLEQVIEYIRNVFK